MHRRASTSCWDHLRVCGADNDASTNDLGRMGSSPRVRSRREPDHVAVKRLRIISACAEQTSCSISACSAARDHLRVCGADATFRVPRPSSEGSSPRVRSRLFANGLKCWSGGIISACAEQTFPPRGFVRRPEDHLRVCGADNYRGAAPGGNMGSSPRVRSRPRRRGRLVAGHGIISACAEQTRTAPPFREVTWDHLRVCGADEGRDGARCNRSGSSPRVRSRRRQHPVQRVGERIISACAEQTQRTVMTQFVSWDHLRVCGADVTVALLSLMVVGSSPRVRSRPARCRPGPLVHGIISACAEQTPPDPVSSAHAGDHLRVCGADIVTDWPSRIHTGSSPRVRSRRRPVVAVLRALGIISACAEQTRIQDRVRRHECGSSPRVRSRPPITRSITVAPGIISACAEQTSAAAATCPTKRDHLRVCGADPFALCRVILALGSSPRVRSRHRYPTNP